MHGNARSPPSHSNSHVDKSVNGSPLRPAHPRPKTKDTHQARSQPARIALPSPSSAIHARQQIEGYGFRPTSGQTTPNGSGRGDLFSPFLTVQSNGASSSRTRDEVDEEKDERDDMDHLPDPRTMDELRDEVRSELAKNGLVDGFQVRPGSEGLQLPEGRGIADEEGLGWPGVSNLKLSWIN